MSVERRLIPSSCVVVAVRIKLLERYNFIVRLGSRASQEAKPVRGKQKEKSSLAHRAYEFWRQVHTYVCLRVYVFLHSHSHSLGQKITYTRQIKNC